MEDKTIKNTCELYDNMNNIMLDSLTTKENFGKECNCNDKRECFFDIDINLVVTPYCLICGGRIELEPKEDDDNKNDLNEERGIPQIRKLKGIVDKTKDL